MNRRRFWLSVGVLVSIGIVVWLAVLIYPRSSAISIGPIGDEAVLSQGAVRVAQGQVPHRDFISIVGGASYYPLAAAFRIFGDSYQVVRTFNLLNALFIIGMTFWIVWPWSRIAALVGVTAFAGLFFPIWPYASYHWMFLGSALLAVGLLVRNQRVWAPAVAGAVLAAASFSVFQKALPVAGALFIFLIAYSAPSAARLKRALIFAFGFAGAFALAVGAMWLNGSLEPYVQQVVIDNLRYYHEAIPGLYFALNSVLILLVVFLATTASPILFRRRSLPEPPPAYFALWWIGLGAAISTLYYLEIVHLSYAMLMLVLVCALTLQRFIVSTRRETLSRSIFQVRWWGALVSVAIFVSCFIAYGRDAIARAYSPEAFGSLQTTVPLETARGTLYSNTQWSGTFASLWVALEPVMQSLEGQRIFFVPYCPGCYYFHKLDNPTPIDFVVTDGMGEASEVRLKKALLEKTDAVVFIPPTWEGFPRDGSLMRWIRATFPVQTDWYGGQIVVMKKS